MSTTPTQPEGEPNGRTQASPLRIIDSTDDTASHRSVADDLHTLALVVAAALAAPLASERHSP